MSYVVHVTVNGALEKEYEFLDFFEAIGYVRKTMKKYRTTLRRIDFVRGCDAPVLSFKTIGGWFPKYGVVEEIWFDIMPLEDAFQTDFVENLELLFVRRIPRDVDAVNLVYLD